MSPNGATSGPGTMTKRVLASVAGWSLLQNPYEDKGFSIALIVLLAVAAREAADFDDDLTATAIRP